MTCYGLNMMTVPGGLVDFSKVASKFVKENNLEQLFNKNVREAFDAVTSYLPHAGFAVFSLTSLNYAFTNLTGCFAQSSQEPGSPSSKPLAADSTETSSVPVSEPAVDNAASAPSASSLFQGASLGTAAWLLEGAADLAETGLLEMTGFVSNVAQYAPYLGVGSLGLEVANSSLEIYSFSQDEDELVTRQDALKMMLKAVSTVCKVVAFSVAFLGLFFAVAEGVALGAAAGLLSYGFAKAESLIGACSSPSEPTSSEAPPVEVSDKPQTENSV